LSAFNTSESTSTLLSQYLSLALVTVLVTTSIRSLLVHSTKVRTTHTLHFFIHPANEVIFIHNKQVLVTFSNIVPNPHRLISLLTTILAMYFLSILPMIRESLPPPYRDLLALLLGGQVHVLDLFETCWVLAAVVTFCGLWLGRGGSSGSAGRGRGLGGRDGLLGKSD
jgi:hypothetical protein